jgi:hypothetical protein
LQIANKLTGRFPSPMNEMYHYPFYVVVGLLFTPNLLPVGQLDGHIIYALFKEKHKYIARTFFG